MANSKTKHRNDVKVVFEVLARNSLVMDGGVRDIKTSGFCCERTIGSDSVTRNPCPPRRETMSNVPYVDYAILNEDRP